MVPSVLLEICPVGFQRNHLHGDAMPWNVFKSVWYNTMGGCSQGGTSSMVFPCEGTRSLGESACLCELLVTGFWGPGACPSCSGHERSCLCNWAWLLQMSHTGAYRNAAASGTHSLLFTWAWSCINCSSLEERLTQSRKMDLPPSEPL